MKSLRIFVTLIIAYALTANTLTASILIPAPKPASLKEKLNSFVDTPYKMAAHYLPVIVQRAMMTCKVPYKAKKAYIEQLVYESATSAEPMERIVAEINIERKSMFSQMITAVGKLNDLDLRYKNLFKFSLARKGNMQIESVVGGEKFIDLSLDANKNTSITQISGKLMDNDVSSLTQANSTSGTLGKYPYNIAVEDIKDKRGKLIAIKSSGSIAGYKIEGKGFARSKGFYEIEEHYGPLLVKTTVKLLS